MNLKDVMKNINESKVELLYLDKLGYKGTIKMFEDLLKKFKFEYTIKDKEPKKTGLGSMYKNGHSVVFSIGEGVGYAIRPPSHWTAKIQIEEVYFLDPYGDVSKTSVFAFHSNFKNDPHRIGIEGMIPITTMDQVMDFLMDIRGIKKDDVKDFYLDINEGLNEYNEIYAIVVKIKKSIRKLVKSDWESGIDFIGVSRKDGFITTKDLYQQGNSGNFHSEDSDLKSINDMSEIEDYRFRIIFKTDSPHRAIDYLKSWVEKSKILKQIANISALKITTVNENSPDDRYISLEVYVSYNMKDKIYKAMEDINENFINKEFKIFYQSTDVRFEKDFLETLKTLSEKLDFRIDSMNYRFIILKKGEEKIAISHKFKDDDQEKIITHLSYGKNSDDNNAGWFSVNTYKDVFEYIIKVWYVEDVMKNINENKYIKTFESFQIEEPKTMSELLEKLSVVEQEILNSIEAEPMDIKTFLNGYVPSDLYQLASMGEFNKLLKTKGLKKTTVENTDDFETFLLSPFRYLNIWNKEKNELVDPDFIMIQTFNSTEQDWNEIRLYKINGDFMNFYNKLTNRTIEFEESGKKYIYQTTNKNEWELTNQKGDDSFPRFVRKEGLLKIINKL